MRRGERAGVWVVAALVLTLIKPSHIEAICSGYPKSCSQIRYIGTTLHGMCESYDEGTKKTSLDLNLCFSNDQGQLKWHPIGQFAKSCSPGRLLETNLYTTCNKRSLEVDVNKHVANQNGVLVCC
ncbi:hypothetical protein SELMODRAFT_415563 [Selaginella moellendorffii]|uniref:Cyanovirin-N domain-containing protein n=1 Tax=Selaginella moellendorffii TaxID=88036 RepID=D8RWI8_SELML|nr:hypothetical protein SELMODRAFT_415563 [Selaginella moellendorffii]